MYFIIDYDERYKPYDKSGNDLKQPAWVKLPAKPKGDGLGMLLEYPRGLEIFAVWCLLLEKTTLEKDPENRGKLLNHKGLPASISEIAKSISLPSKSILVGIAINALIEIGWVGCDDDTEVTSANFQKTSSKSRVEKSRVEKSKYSQNSTTEFRLAALLLSEIQKRKPDYKKPNLQAWTKHIDRMVCLDNRKPERIEAVIRWCQADAPKTDGGFGWQDNILSTAKLREKFDKLELAMQRDSQYTKPLERGKDGLTPRQRTLADIRKE